MTILDNTHCLHGTKEHKTNMSFQLSPMFFNIFTASLLAITAILILAGNIFVLLILHRIQTSVYNDVTKLFMRSLTVSDLMVGIFVVIPNIGRWANGGIWPYGTYSSLISQIYLKVHVLVLLSGLLSLMVITVERYIAVAYALRYPYIVNKKRARILVAVVWAISVTFAAAAQSSTDVSPKQLDAKQNVSATGNESSFNSQLQLESESITELELDRIKNVGGSNASLWSNVFLLVALPIATVIILSIKLYAIARRHATQIEAQQRQLNSFKKDYKAAVTFFIVAGCFALAWLPNFVLKVYLAYQNYPSSASPNLDNIMHLFLYCNSWWNVFIYYLRNRSFRSEAKKMFPRSLRREDDTMGNSSEDVVPTVSSRLHTNDNCS